MLPDNPTLQEVWAVWKDCNVFGRTWSYRPRSFSDLFDDELIADEAVALVATSAAARKSITRLAAEAKTQPSGPHAKRVWNAVTSDTGIEDLFAVQRLKETPATRERFVASVVADLLALRGLHWARTSAQQWFASKDLLEEEIRAIGQTLVAKGIADVDFYRALGPRGEQFARSLQLPPEVWRPNNRVLLDLHAHSQHLLETTSEVVNEAIQFGKTGSKNLHVDEVATLAWFFLHGLPKLRRQWNAVLKHTSVEIKSVFCHKSGKLGPVVRFETNGIRRCELADLLLIVTGNGATSGRAFANAAFFQSKTLRLPIKGPSSLAQKALFEEADDFTFVDPTGHKGDFLGETHPPGKRWMPSSRERGFKFWFYEGSLPSCFRGRLSGLWLSTTAEPHRIDYPQLDESFAVTVFNLLTGRDGLGVCVPKRGDFGWNRIIRDVLASAVDKALAVPHKIDAHGATRISGWSAAQLANLFANDAVTLADSLTELGAWFRDDEMRERMACLAPESGFDFESVGAGDFGKAPPNWSEGDADDGGGGASVIWINLKAKE